MSRDDAQDAAAVSLDVVFGRVLQELRRERGLSQERLALESGYHRTYISLLERGINGPSLDAIFQFAAVLDTSPSELVKKVEIRVGRIPRRERRTP